MRHNRTLAKRVCKKIVAYMNGEDKTKRKRKSQSSLTCKCKSSWGTFSIILQVIDPREHPLL